MKYDAEEKYQGMVRASARLAALASDLGQTAVVGDPAAKDAATSFFMECYHLKDWLKKDARVKRPADVENFISKSCGLSVAADLCNSLKHAGLDKQPRSGAHLDQINMAYSIDISISQPGNITFVRNPSDGDTVTISRTRLTGRPIATAKVVVTIGGNKYDAPELAARCVDEWDAFLKSQGIEFAKS